MPQCASPRRACTIQFKRSDLGVFDEGGLGPAEARGGVKGFFMLMDEEWVLLWRNPPGGDAYEELWVPRANILALQFHART